MLGIVQEVHLIKPKSLYSYLGLHNAGNCARAAPNKAQIIIFLFRSP